MTAQRVTVIGGSRRARAAIAGIGAVLAFATLTGCAAGQRAQTAVETPVVDGVGATVGNIEIRDASIAPPEGTSYDAGTDADLQLVIVNNGGTDDALVSVTTSAATGANFYPNAVAAASDIANLLAPSGSATASQTATPTDSTSDSSSPSPTATSTQLAQIAVPIGPDTQIGVTESDPVIVLTGLTQALEPAAPVKITFVFAKAGSVTVTLPVALTTGSVSPSILPIEQSSDD